MSPQGRHRLQKPGALPWEALKGGPRLALAQGAGWPVALGQGQYVVALVTNHLQQGLQRDRPFRKKEKRPEATRPSRPCPSPRNAHQGCAQSSPQPLNPRAGSGVPRDSSTTTPHRPSDPLGNHLERGCRCALPPDGRPTSACTRDSVPTTPSISLGRAQGRALGQLPRPHHGDAQRLPSSPGTAATTAL